MGLKRIRVRNYERFKNGKWEHVRDYEKDIDIVHLEKQLIDDVRNGKAIRLSTEELPYRLPSSIGEYSDVYLLWTNLNEEQRNSFLEHVGISDAQLIASFDDTEDLSDVDSMQLRTFVENI